MDTSVCAVCSFDCDEVDASFEGRSFVQAVNANAPKHNNPIAALRHLFICHTVHLIKIVSHTYITYFRSILFSDAARRRDISVSYLRAEATLCVKLLAKCHFVTASSYIF